MKKLYLILASLLLSLLTFSQTATEPTSGAGNETDPYEIQSLENLYWISQNSAFWDAHYIQTADIDATETETWFAGEGFSPIGNETTRFTGSYDGNGHKISNLHIARADDYVALFGVAGENGNPAEFKNMALENVQITVTTQAAYWCAAALVGWLEYGTINNCYATGEVTGEEYAGGLAGQVEGTINNSYSTCTVTGTEVVGGLAAYGGMVTNCAAYGVVSGTSEVGGLVGYNDDEIHYCYAKGNVSGEISVGGLVGHNRNASTNPYISNSYAWGNVTRLSGSVNENIAAFVGLNDDNAYSENIIEHCYAIGSVSYEGVENPVNKGFVGGEIGIHTYTANFFNSSTSGQTSGIGATMQITSGMKTGSTFTDAGWDFMGETTNGENDYWGINQNENSGYPFLKWQGYKLHSEVSEWPTVSIFECGEALSTAELTGGTASVVGTFGFADPAIIPPLGTSQQQLQFVPDDTETYESVSEQTEVNVDDTQAPIPFVNELPAVTAECEINELSAPTATDACAGEVVGTHDISLPITTQGTYTVTWTYDDGNGNVETQIQSLVVEDTTTPTITCPADQSIDLVSEESVYTVSGTEFDPTGTSDNCEVASIENDFNNTETLAGAELPPGTTTITWTATDNAGNSAECSFDVTVNAYVGVSDMANEILIYPNPTSGILTIDFPSSGGQGNVKSLDVTDISGRTIQQIHNSGNQNFEIDLSEQPAGIYFLKLQTNEGIFTEKIIKK